jgi:acyl-CoA reductase-like NAD-dependent aldehyde dehydrogenase
MKFYNIINGERREGETAHQCTDPRTEEPLWDAPIATIKDLDEAVAAAQQAMKTWGKSTIEERKALLVKMADTYQANKEELFEIVMKETGKSVV